MICNLLNQSGNLIGFQQIVFYDQVILSGFGKIPFHFRKAFFPVIIGQPQICSLTRKGKADFLPDSFDSPQN